MKKKESKILRLFLLLICTLIFAMGLVMIFSTTSAEVLDHDLDKSTYQSLLKQVIFGALGCLGASFIYWIGIDRLLRYSYLLVAVFSFFLLITLIPGVGRVVNGSRRWLSIGGVSFQPSEFVKYLVPFAYIYSISKWHTFCLKRFVKLVFFLSIPVFLILIEPNNGTAAVIMITLVNLFFLSKVPFRYYALPLLCLALIGTVFAHRLPYVAARLKVYLNPEYDITGKGHQPYQAKIAAGSGKIWGKGPGNSIQKLSYLPEAQNDYIAAIYAEEFGFTGIVILIFLYMSLGYVGFAIAYASPTQEGYYLAGTVTFLICFQSFLNLGVVSGILPSTGLNLPLFSQGGTSLVANIIGVSFLWSISNSRNAKAEKEEADLLNLN